MANNVLALERMKGLIASKYLLGVQAIGWMNVAVSNVICVAARSLFEGVYKS